MAAPIMELFGSYTSPYVRQCRVAALDTGLPVTLVETDAARSAPFTPTLRVPYFRDGSLTLTDSASITRYLREKAGQAFLPQVLDQELFSLAGTVLDTAINVFLFERQDGLTPERSPYLQKQATRIQRGLEALNEVSLPSEPSFNDAHIRIACLLAWGLFRGRFALDGLNNLQRFLALADEWEPFSRTAPPAGAPLPAFAR